MTEKASTAVRGFIAIAIAAVLAGGLYFVFGAAPGEGDDERDAGEYEHQSEAREGRGDSAPEALVAAAQALHPGRVVETESGRGGSYEIETVDAQGVKWKMVFDAEGRLVRDERD